MMQDVAGVKVNVELFCLFQNSKSDGTVQEKKSFLTKSREILPQTSMEDVCSTCI